MPHLLTSTPEEKTGEAAHLPRLLLAHGAGQGMTSPFFETLTELLLERGITVTRFEFDYMAARRDGGKRRPPPRIAVLLDEYRAAIEALRGEIGADKLVIGGKSMGGRAASMIADELYGAGAIAGLVCLGYPFHPPKKPESVRTTHLAGLNTPALIVQGERDPFGTQAEIEGYDLAKPIRLKWIGDGDHDLNPRTKSGFTRKGNLAAAADAVRAFLAELAA